MQLSNLRSTPLIVLATEGKRRTPWWLAFIIGIVAVVVGLTAVMGIGQAVLGYAEGSALSQVVEAVAFAAMVLIIVLWIRLYDGRGFTSLGFRGRGIARLLLGVVIGAVLMTMVVGLSTLLGGFAFNASPDRGSLGGAAIGVAVALVVAVLVQATGEEIVWRGFVQQASGLGLPGALALVLPAFGFTVLHFTGGIVPLAFLCVFLFGTFAALIALREGSLWLIAGIHTGWNWAQGNLFGAPVSGNPREAAVFAITPNAAAGDLVTGGAFGPEGSIAAVIVFAVAVVVAWLYFRSGPKSAPDA